MWTDPIAEEIHQQRKQHAAEFGFDVHRVYLELKRLDESPSPLDAPVVTLPPKRPSVIERVA